MWGAIVEKERRLGQLLLVRQIGYMTYLSSLRRQRRSRSRPVSIRPSGLRATAALADRLLDLRRRWRLYRRSAMTMSLPSMLQGQGVALHSLLDLGVSSLLVPRTVRRSSRPRQRCAHKIHHVTNPWSSSHTDLPLTSPPAPTPSPQAQTSSRLIARPSHL